MSMIPEELKLDYFKKALADKLFIPYYQPQYNNFTGMVVGCEALCRLDSPEYGLIMPKDFIALLEENDLISELDLIIFEKICIFLKNCIDNKVHMVPVSFNLSRADIYKNGFIEKIEEIRKSYDIPVEYLRVEVTETLAQEGKDKAKAIVDRLHELGYTVELDDFGSGYSSLNILKDIDYDILKLDMFFLNNDLKGRGGTIISSVVRMAKWLKMPVIAEGVETKEQVDFMKSIGCDYTQGYIYSRPLKQEDYYHLLTSSNIGLTTASMNIKETVNPISFWSEKSLDTLVFNNYVGAAAVFSYDRKDKIEVLRVNKKYVVELGMNTSEYDIVRNNPLNSMDLNNKLIYKDTLNKVIESEEEQECETWRTISSLCCGDENLCIRSTITLIGKSENEYIFYAAIRNITAEKKRLDDGMAYERGFRQITEQANIYYWEYTVATKEMRPCFRCMRDLGLPPLVTNYPEPAIEQGIFPADYADMYRDWHKQIAAGVEHLEAIIPLTVGRVPFHVRYTTEFDELHRPVKAYGSATLVTDADVKSYLEKNKKDSL